MKTKSGDFLKLINNFKTKHIGVIGDVMLDKFASGDVDRISPEAPVPVIKIVKELAMPGGAGNVASNIAALGATASIIGLVGKDEPGRQLIADLKRRGVDCHALVVDRKKHTPYKTRIVARTQHLLRIDVERDHFIDAPTEKRLLKLIKNAMPSWDGVVLSDYAKGCITKNLARKVIALAKKNSKFVIADSKTKHASFYKGATLLTPNRKEAIELGGDDDVKKSSRIIAQKLRCSVLVTLGADGMELYSKGKAKYFPTQAREVSDVSGAGDTVVAALALSLASGADLAEAAAIANYAAGIVVSKLGTATVSLDELSQALLHDA